MFGKLRHYFRPVGANGGPQPAYLRVLSSIIPVLIFFPERTFPMNRQNLPNANPACDMPAQITEIRLPMRSGRHNARNEREARP